MQQERIIREIKGVGHVCLKFWEKKITIPNILCEKSILTDIPLGFNLESLLK